MQNIEKDTIPVIGIGLLSEDGTPVKLQLRLLEQDTGFGLGVFGFLNSTAVEDSGPAGPLPSPEEYWLATRGLLTVGHWINKSKPANLVAKLGRYKGGVSTYPSDNHKKKSWFVLSPEEQRPAPAAGIFPLDMIDTSSRSL